MAGSCASSGGMMGAAAATCGRCVRGVRHTHTHTLLKCTTREADTRGGRSRSEVSSLYPPAPDLSLSASQVDSTFLHLCTNRIPRIQGQLRDQRTTICHPCRSQVDSSGVARGLECDDHEALLVAGWVRTGAWLSVRSTGGEGGGGREGGGQRDGRGMGASKRCQAVTPVCDTLI